MNKTNDSAFPIRLNAAQTCVCSELTVQRKSQNVHKSHSANTYYVDSVNNVWANSAENQVSLCKIFTTDDKLFFSTYFPHLQVTSYIQK